MKPKLRILLLTLVALVLVFGSLSGALGLQPTRAQGKTLTVAFAQEPDHLNPYYTNMAFAQWASFLLYANLWDYDDKLKAVPVLVKEIPTVANGGVSKDGKTITIKLKPNLKWSDGQPLTSDDLAFSYQMTLDKANNFTIGPLIQEQVATKDNIKVIDPQTIAITTKDAQFPEQIAGVGNFYVLPKHVFEPAYTKDKTLEKADADQNPTAFSGPYLLKEWKRGESMTFTANPDFILGKPKIDTVVIRIFPDPESANAAFVSGDVDFLVNLQAGEVIALQKQTKEGTHVGIYGSYRESLWIK